MSTFALGSFAVATVVTSVFLGWLASPDEPALPVVVGGEAGRSTVRPAPAVEAGIAPAAVRRVDGGGEAGPSPAAPVTVPPSAPTSTADEGTELAAMLDDPAVDADTVDEALRRLGVRLAERQGTDPAANRRLLAGEALAAQHGRLPTWLEALGSSRHVDAVAAVQRHLRVAEPEVRAAAIAALVRQAPTAPATLARLHDLAVGDPSPLVRSRAVVHLAVRHDAAVFGTLTAVLDRETAVDVRRAALLVLAHAADRDAAVAILRRVAASDADDGTRTLANELLARSRA